MIKWRESRDLLYSRKFDWVFVEKIAKFQKNFGECTVRLFFILFAFCEYLLAPDPFFSLPCLLPDERKTSFRGGRGSRSQLKDSTLVHFSDTRLLFVAFPLTIAFSRLRQALKLSYNERTIDRSLTAKCSPIIPTLKSDQMLKSGSQRFYTFLTIIIFILPSKSILLTKKIF